MKSILVIVLLSLCATIQAQEENYIVGGALGMYKKQIISIFGTKYELKSNENGSAILSYKLEEKSTASGYYTVSCMILLNSNYECYYITAILPATEYKRTVALLNDRFKTIGYNKWRNNDGNTIQAELDTYQSGSIFTLTFYP